MKIEKKLLGATMAAFAILILLLAASAAGQQLPGSPVPTPAADTPALTSAGGAIYACPGKGSCATGFSYPLATWRSMFGRGHGSGELVGLLTKDLGPKGAGIGLGVAHVFLASSGASAPRTSAALGIGFVMPLSGTGGLKTSTPVVFLVVGVGAGLK